MTRSPSGESGLLRYLLALGPALIVASVVLGPGSILTSSKVGAQYGYGMVWVLVLAVGLMAGMTALAARIGVTIEHSPGDELARRLGRPVAAIVGLCVFAICACFQFSNNLGVLAALEPIIADFHLSATANRIVQNAVLFGLNLVIIAAMFGLRHLYKPIEKLMMILVGLMLIGFAGNLILAQPDPLALLKGLVPKLPAVAETGNAEASMLDDALLPLLGLVATTFSIAGAYYQAYLVKEKGWTADNLKQGFVDSLAGISVLGGISLMIMATSAAVLHGRIDPGELKSAADVAFQLEPLFGNWAVWLFCLGIFAGAFSSFLMNAMIGGGLMADGLGVGSSMDSRNAKLFTVAVLLIGMAIASAITFVGQDQFVGLIVAAQAITVIGLPPLAAALLYLLRCGDRNRSAGQTAMMAIGWLGLLVALVLAGRTVYMISGRVNQWMKASPAAAESGPTAGERPDSADGGKE